MGINQRLTHAILIQNWPSYCQDRQTRIILGMLHVLYFLVVSLS